MTGRCDRWRWCRRMRCRWRAVLVVLIVTGCDYGKADNNMDRFSVTSVDPAREEPQRTLTPVRCDLRCESTSDGVLARLTFKNTSEEDILVTKRNLLVGAEGEHLTWSPFTITNNGNQMPYSGMLVKRREPSKEDYTTLRPGQVVEASTNISRPYKLAANSDVSPTRYRVYYRSVNVRLVNGMAFDIVSNVVEATGQRADR
jgi:hypothetical protein